MKLAGFSGPFFRPSLFRGTVRAQNTPSTALHSGQCGRAALDARRELSNRRAPERRQENHRRYRNLTYHNLTGKPQQTFPSIFI